MRIIAFCLTLFLGITIASVFNPISIFTEKGCNDSSLEQGIVHRTVKTRKMSEFDLSGNYTEKEARNLIGKRVRNLNSSNTKCPTESGNCLEINVGDLGYVAGMLPSEANTYLIQIEWDELSQDAFHQYEGKFVTRAGKEVSFEIIK
jgi:hypothetical protein